MLKKHHHRQQAGAQYVKNIITGNIPSKPTVGNIPSNPTAGIPRFPATLRFKVASK
jgi:hypothetical protein